MRQHVEYQNKKFETTDKKLMNINKDSDKSGNNRNGRKETGKTPLLNLDMRKMDRMLDNERRSTTTTNTTRNHHPPPPQKAADKGNTGTTPLMDLQNSGSPPRGGAATTGDTGKTPLKDMQKGCNLQHNNNTKTINLINNTPTNP